jgi:ribosomal protein L13
MIVESGGKLVQDDRRGNASHHARGGAKEFRAPGNSLKMFVDGMANRQNRTRFSFTRLPPLKIHKKQLQILKRFDIGLWMGSLL